MSTFNPACYLPSHLNTYLQSSLPSIACAPPPSYLTQAYTALTSPFSSTYTVLRTGAAALTSLPVLSLLLVPTFASTSTSLNLLFFYITWSTLILSHSPLTVEIVATLAVRILFYILPSLSFLAFDIALPKTAEGLKALGAAGLPYKGAGRIRIIQNSQIIGVALANTLLGIALQAAIEFLLAEVFLVRSALQITTWLPVPWDIVKHLFWALLLRESLAYVIHRYLLHEGVVPFTYVRLRLPAPVNLPKLHMNWAHSLAAPFPLSGAYDHPITYALHVFLPTFLPALVLRMHLLTYLLYLAFVSLEECVAYSGYSTLPTNFVLGGVARRTDLHILSSGEGNFGCWGLADWILGTSVGGDIAEDLLDEAVRQGAKHDWEGKADNAVEKTKRRASKLLHSGNGESSGGSKPRRRQRRKSSRDVEYED